MKKDVTGEPIRLVADDVSDRIPEGMTEADGETGTNSPTGSVEEIYGVDEVRASHLEVIPVHNNHGPMFKQGIFDHGLMREEEKMTGKTFTGTKPSKVEKVDLKNIAQVAAQLHMDVVSRFKGVPVIVDKKLMGHNYYIAVSQDLYDQINEEQR